MFKIGDKVRDRYEFSGAHTIVKPRRGERPPTPDWFIVRHEGDGSRSCMHRDMLLRRND